jgi:hypothetical protein
MNEEDERKLKRSQRTSFLRNPFGAKKDKFMYCRSVLEILLRTRRKEFRR